MGARWRCLVAIGVALGVAASASAQSFPSRPVKFVTPFSAGAGPTVFLRALAESLSTAWSQPVIVEARPGGSGFAAIDLVKRAPPDGYELLVVSNAHLSINPAMFATLPYDPERDLAPVARVYRTPFFVVVRSQGPYADVPSLVAAAKERPGRVSYGSQYVGSPSHLGGAEFAYLTGTTMIHVPFSDQSQLYVAVANGDVDWAFATLGSALPLASAGKLRFLAVAARSRSPALPDVPTLAEAGGPAGLEVDAWMAMMAPRGTPDDVVRRIHADVARALGEPAIRERLAAFGFDAAPGTPEEIARERRTDAARYGEIVRRIGARAE